MIDNRMPPMTASLFLKNFSKKIFVIVSGFGPIFSCSVISGEGVDGFGCVMNNLPPSLILNPRIDHRIENIRN